MAVQTAAGIVLALGPATTANTQAALAALTYTEIAEIENIGDFGDTANEVTFTALSDRRVRKFKGSFNAGTMSLTLGNDSSDAGQVALKAALASDDDFAIKITYQDGAIDYFRAKVMSYVRQVGNVENIVRRTVSLGVNSEIFEVAAPTGGEG